MLIEVVGVERSAIKPDTLLEDIVPRKKRRKIWKRLRKSFRNKRFYLVKLQLSKTEEKLELLIMVISLVVIMAVWVCYSFVHSIPVLVICALILENIDYHSGIEFPKSCSTIRDLVWYLDLHKSKSVYTRDDVERKLKHLLVTMFDLTPDEI